MKIFYYFPEYDTPMFSWQRTHFIDELQRHGIQIDLFNPLVYDNPSIANEDAIARIKKSGYDLFMSSVCYEGMIYPTVLETAQKKGIPTLCIRWDNLAIPFFDEYQASKFDLLWLTAKETANLYQKWGAKFIIQPYAANPYTFCPGSTGIIKRICFIGTPYGSRSLMINLLTNNQVPVTAFYGGNKTQKHSSVNKYDMITPSTTRILIDRLRFKQGRKIMWGMIVNKLAKKSSIEHNDFLEHFDAIEPKLIDGFYSKYAVSLASTSTNHTDALRHPLKIINLRNFEIPMSGGVELCKYNEELAGYFEENKEILFYRSDEELIEKAKYFTEKASNSEIMRIKEAARKRAESEHTWYSRFKRAFDALGIKC